MADGLSIFSGISTAFHLSKSIAQFVRDVKDATRASRVLIDLVDDDIDNLEAYEKVLETNKHRLSPDQRDRLQRLNARMGKTHDDLRQKLQRYRDANLKDELSWSAHGASLQKDEENLRGWISRLHDCLADLAFLRRPLREALSSPPKPLPMIEVVPPPCHQSAGSAAVERRPTLA